jgi:hypothetical protein
MFGNVFANIRAIRGSPTGVLVGRLVRAMTEPPRYRVYLLRLWQAEGDDGPPIWRAALEDARTGERRGFADLARLCTYLEEQTANWTGRQAHPPEPEA